ncbi:MAG: M23 family metallopeptidase [Bacteroidetes bacterium]|nr:MAG: M23 family metallopeptidase [Bacteroidota bacterium]
MIRSKYLVQQAALFALLLSFLCSKGQTNGVIKYPQGYFANPLKIPMSLSANFGELRPNHWHMGLDIRTEQKENLPVFASADGYVAHIGIRPQSFGKFIIINHPNGYSTLYAHLNEFYPALEKYVREKQTEKESWAIELDFTEKDFKIKKGNEIAKSGNTGGSQGPHLHFEIRETKTDRSLNPLLFGMPLEDNVAPTLLKLAMYDRSISTYEQTPKIFSLKKADSGYVIPNMPILKTGFKKLSFAIQAVDKFTGSQNGNGIYTARILKDGERIAEFILDQIDYSESEYVNAQIDYRYFKAGKGYFQHISPLPGREESIYHLYNRDGLIHLDDVLPHTITIQVGDANENFSSTSFLVQFTDSDPTNKTVHNPNNLIAGIVNVIEKKDFEAFLPERCIYDTIPTVYNSTNTTLPNAVSDLHQLNDNSYPVHEEMTIRIKPTIQVKKEWRDKIVIQRNGGNAVLKPVWQGEWLSAKTGAFGSFIALVDLTPPQLNSIGKGDTVNLSPASRIVFTPTDNSGIKNFRAELDGKWLMFTNDKGRNWIYKFDEQCPFGVHELKVRAEDIAGNVTEKIWWFKKYPYTPPPPKKKKKATAKKKTTVKKK